MARLDAISIRNVKGIAKLDLTAPPGPVVYVIGANETGKSTVLDAILYALAGKGSIPADVIRKGAEKGLVKLRLDDGTVIERRITPTSSSLAVTLPSGLEAKSPQAKLDALVGPISLDPWAFINADARAQRETLLRVAGLAEALAEIEARREAAADERRLAGRNVKRLDGLCASIAVPFDAPEAPPSEDERQGARDALAEANAHIRDRMAIETQVREAKANEAHYSARVQTLERELAGARDELTHERIRLRDAEAKLADLEALPAATTAEALDAMKALEDRERAFRAAEDVRKALREKAEAEATLEKLDEAVAAIAEEQNALFETIDLGMGGVEVRDLGVYVEGVPFHNLATSLKLKLAFALAMKSAPELRLVRVRDGNVLDEQSRAFVERLATELGFQVWIEFVKDTGLDGVILTEKIGGGDE